MRSHLTILAATALLTLSAMGSAHADGQPTGEQLKFGWVDLPKDSQHGVVQHGRFALTNKGEHAVDGVILEFKTTRGIELPQRFSNCEYSTLQEDASKIQFIHNSVLCFVPGTYEPGASYDVAPKIDMVGGDVAYKEWFQTAAYADTPATRARLRGEKPGAKGTGPALKLEQLPKGEPAPQVDSDDDFRYPNTADLSVKGAQVEGAAGAHVTAALEMNNLGPAWVSELWEFSPIAYVDIDFPDGVKVIKAPKGCWVAHKEQDEDHPNAPVEAAGVDYRCMTGAFVLEHEKVSYPFELQLGSHPGTGKGSITVLSKMMSGFDHKPQDDRAEIVVKTKGGNATTGGSGGAGSTGGTTASGASGSAGTSGSSGTSGSTSAGTTAGGSTAGTTSGGTATSASAQGGSLASTGSSAALAGAGALSLLAAGTLVRRAVRRR
ncbi:hypothetical protein ACGFW5_13480 [Streptomyces sp. NPDC048416]|uniref:hypothetical protein n=1 Tax=Streptomyces sp. NPDC048416 TaxID=3365546 RepID=UPI00371372F5